MGKVSYREFFESVERKTNLLVEERSFASTPYRKTINKILKFCQIRCNQLKPGESIRFEIPETITREIDIISNLRIYVTVADKSITSDVHGGGSVEVQDVGPITNNKLSTASISIEGYSFNGILYDRTILASLCHELNHLKEVLEDKIKYNDIKRSLNSLKKIGSGVVTKDKQLDDFLHMVTYRLFSETELNALISSVYGDLKGIRSKRETYKEDIKQTKAYSIYKAIKEDLTGNLKLLKAYSPQLKTYLNRCNIELSPYGNSDDAYIKDFGRKVAFLLKRLYKGIGKVASLYYDDVEFEIPRNIYKTKLG